MNITTKQLLDAPDGIIFYLQDLPAMPPYLKIETVKDDIVVCAIMSEDKEHFRLGLREKDKTDCNSLIWHVLTERELQEVINYLESAVAMDADIDEFSEFIA